MKPALSSLYMLHTMGMTIYPEPCRTDKEVEEVEGAVALFRQHANALRRIEFISIRRCAADATVLTTLYGGFAHL